MSTNQPQIIHGMSEPERELAEAIQKIDRQRKELARLNRGESPSQRERTLKEELEKASIYEGLVTRIRHILNCEFSESADAAAMRVMMKLDTANRQMIADANELIELRNERTKLVRELAEEREQRGLLEIALKNCVAVMENELAGLNVIQPELRGARTALAAVKGGAE